VKIGGRTVELWPISPDRLHPVPSRDVTEWMAGFALDESTTVSFEPEDIIHHKFFNPANPLLGIGPLQAAAKAVDTDVDQQNWNKSAMQNRGVIDGVMTFDREFSNQDEASAIADKLNERYAGPANARRIGVVGSNAKYNRLALTPVELDFMESRKFNREEIFIIFGVPPQYAGVQESSTYNNYATSEQVFWFSTIIPILDDLSDTFNFSFRDELGDTEQITYDVSNINAIRSALLDKTETAQKMFEMGVPFEQLNEVFSFGFEEFEGWGQSNVAVKTDNVQQQRKFTLIEKRDIRSEQDEIDKTAKGVLKPVFEELLMKQQKAVFQALDKNKMSNISDIISKTHDEWLETLNGFYITIGSTFGQKIVVEKREFEDEIILALREYLDEEDLAVAEMGFIEETTITAVMLQVEQALDEGWAMGDIQQAIIDTGVFSESRALMLARTITGNAVNLGQWKSAELSGAKYKTWRTALFEVRDSHKKMEGVTVGIDEDFHVGHELARYPLDNRLSPAERANCRCTLTYSV
jgi:HK97 family phage portal protein